MEATNSFNVSPVPVLLYSTSFITTAPQILGMQSEERKQVGASVVKEGQEQSDKSVVRSNDCGVDADGYGGLLVACVLMIH
jgi:hypothetical protein